MHRPPRSRVTTTSPHCCHRINGSGLIFTLPKEAHIPGGMNFDFVLDFHDMYKDVHAMFHERGPGARWIKIIGYMNCLVSRAIL